jgi:putative ribosome biogenesis GTPase RsgA
VLPRAEERAQLQTALTRKRAAVLRGPSGTGKSVLAGLELLGRTESELVL